MTAVFSNSFFIISPGSPLVQLVEVHYILKLVEIIIKATWKRAGVYRERGKERVSEAFGEHSASRSFVWTMDVDHIKI